MAKDAKVKESGETKDIEKRCFVMMPISDQGDYPIGHFNKVYNQIFKPAIEKAGYKPYRVDENTISDSIVNKIFDAVQNCEMALCDLSNRNPNVLYELGLRQAYNKPVVLVCDDKTDKIFDVSGISTVFYKSDRLYENVLEAQEEIYEALKSTGGGEEATLVQVVNATAANYNSATLDKDEKIDIMLRSILNEVRKFNISKGDNYDKDKSNYKVCEVEIANAHKLTYDQVEKIFSDISNIKVLSLNLTNDGQFVLLKVRYIDNSKVLNELVKGITEIGLITYSNFNLA